MKERICSLAHSLKIPITRIGEILPVKEGLHIIKKNGKDYSPSRLGFEHFKGWFDKLTMVILNLWKEETDEGLY